MCETVIGTLKQMLHIIEVSL